jgi:hypothetical protein
MSLVKANFETFSQKNHESGQYAHRLNFENFTNAKKKLDTNLLVWNVDSAQLAINRIIRDIFQL